MGGPTDIMQRPKRVMYSMSNRGKQEDQYQSCLFHSTGVPEQCLWFEFVSVPS